MFRDPLTHIWVVRALVILTISRLLSRVCYINYRPTYNYLNCNEPLSINHRCHHINVFLVLCQRRYMLRGSSLRGSSLHHITWIDTNLWLYNLRHKLVLIVGWMNVRINLKLKYHVTADELYTYRLVLRLYNFQSDLKITTKDKHVVIIWSSDSKCYGH